MHCLTTTCGVPLNRTISETQRISARLADGNRTTPNIFTIYRKDLLSQLMSDLFEQWNKRERLSESRPEPPKATVLAASPPTAPATATRNSFSSVPSAAPPAKPSNPFSRANDVPRSAPAPTAQAATQRVPDVAAPLPPAVPPQPDPIFALEGHPWRDRVEGAKMVVVGNSVVVVALANCRVRRWRVNRDLPPEDIELCRPQKQETISRF
jgi:hypothetical protein